MQSQYVTFHIKYVITFNATFDINEFTTYLPCPQPDGGHRFPIVQFYSGKGAIHLWRFLYPVSRISCLTPCYNYSLSASLCVPFITVNSCPRSSTTELCSKTCPVLEVRPWNYVPKLAQMQFNVFLSCLLSFSLISRHFLLQTYFVYHNGSCCHRFTLFKACRRVHAYMF